MGTDPTEGLRPLLVSRKKAAALLSVSYSTVCRLERLGRLRAVKLWDSEKAATFYELRDIEELARKHFQAAGR